MIKNFTNLEAHNQTADEYINLLKERFISGSILPAQINILIALKTIPVGLEITEQGNYCWYYKNNPEMGFRLVNGENSGNYYPWEYPNYYGSLDEMRKAERILDNVKSVVYRNNICELIDAEPKDGALAYAWHASAKIRSLAWIKTVYYGFQP